MKDGFFTTLALALTVFGCVEEPGSNHFLVDTRFIDCRPGLNCEMEVLRHVADEFRQAFGQSVDITFEQTLDVDDFSYNDWEDYDGENAKLFKISFSDEGYEDLATHVEQDFYGLSRPGRAIVLVDDAYALTGDHVYFSVMERIVMHEFGHHIGLEHGDGTIMEKHTDSVQHPGDEYPCVDRGSVDAFCRLHVCDGTQQPTCK